MDKPKLQAQSVSEDEADIRLDRWFKRHFPVVTHGQLQKLLRTGQIRVDGKRVEAATRLKAGQSIRVPPQASQPPPAEHVQRRSAELANKLKSLILFEDDDVIVLNKPAGLAVQGGTGLKENLDDMLMDLSRDGHNKPKLVHRLDRDTSGVLLLARTTFAAAKLTEAFRDRVTKKIYWAISLGVPSMMRGKISAPLIKDGEIMRVVERDEGKLEEMKSAITLYQVMESAKKHAAFLALWPITGRTHQLRVHLAYIGNPILGDPIYAREATSSLPLKELGKGLHLHARQLIIPHPRRGRIDVLAPLGREMQKTWQWFGFDTKAVADFTE